VGGKADTMAVSFFLNSEVLSVSTTPRRGGKKKKPSEHNATARQLLPGQAAGGGGGGGGEKEKHLPKRKREIAQHTSHHPRPRQFSYKYDNVRLGLQDGKKKKICGGGRDAVRIWSPCPLFSRPRQPRKVKKKRKRLQAQGRGGSTPFRLPQFHLTSTPSRRAEGEGGEEKEKRKKDRGREKEPVADGGLPVIYLPF